MTWKFISNLGDTIRSVPDVWIDCGLYIGMGLTSFWALFFGTDEASKYIAAAPLFWLKCTVGSLDALLLAAKLFRSTAFAGHVEQKRSDETTRLLKSQIETKAETKP
jgi:hypothetical protein